MAYWTHVTDKGTFSIVERPTSGVNAYFGQTLIGHYRSPVEAAAELSHGHHADLPCAPDDGESLGVPNVHDWTFVNE